MIFFLKQQILHILFNLLIGNLKKLAIYIWNIYLFYLKKIEFHARMALHQVI